MNSRVFQDAALLCARIGVGIVFIAHGWDKLFNTGIAQVADNFLHLGIPQPLVSSYAVAAIELSAGAALTIGLVTPLAAGALTILMLCALYFVHIGHGYSVATGGFELVVALGAATILIAVFGAGRASCDHFLGTAAN